MLIFHGENQLSSYDTVLGVQFSLQHTVSFIILYSISIYITKNKDVEKKKKDKSNIFIPNINWTLTELSFFHHWFEKFNIKKSNKKTYKWKIFANAFGWKVYWRDDCPKLEKSVSNKREYQQKSWIMKKIYSE
ncbi:hypothetical protein RFI_11551 [Reticulomyxa filosa]|uniref:Uncharacterized protein n=1 Tax=Reticulomyxa filosa TaxID=46433 RepID=X6NHU5_RETFI|nr:hypothetical protein RFI_11551 [Reticulomyxa filosa]|eukprot:ETO25586.1 hypothetical protein RFI_11551 [Reticulomyxa filosa]